GTEPFASPAWQASWPTITSAGLGWSCDARSYCPVAGVEADRLRTMCWPWGGRSARSRGDRCRCRRGRCLSSFRPKHDDGVARRRGRGRRGGDGSQLLPIVVDQEQEISSAGDRTVSCFGTNAGSGFVASGDVVMGEGGREESRSVSLLPCLDGVSVAGGQT